MMCEEDIRDVGSRIFDFLTESFLFDDSLIRERFRDIPESEITSELKRYRDFCLSVAPEIETEISNSPVSNLRLFSGIKHINLALLKQASLYVQQHILYCPLFELTHELGSEKKATTAALNSFLGFNQAPFDRERLAKVLGYLQALRPMVAANYVKLLPTSYFFEPPPNLPLTYSETGFEERVPKDLRQFFHDAAIVESVKDVDGAKIIDGSFEIGRGIHVRFRDHGMQDANGYLLLPVASVGGEGSTLELSMVKTTAPPEREEFEAWVFQSINQTAGRAYTRVLTENMFAHRLNASYLSDSPFVFRLLEQIVPTEADIPTNTVNALINVELPRIDNVDVETLMRVRMDEGEAFENFRLELDSKLAELRLETDPDRLKAKTENVMHQLMDVQVRHIDQKVSSLKKQILSEAVITAVSLVGAVQSSGFTLPIALLAAFHGYKSISQYQSQKRENPAFFLWKVLKHS
jgi:hypothetical protein